MSRKQRHNVTEIARSIVDDDPSYRQGRIPSHLHPVDYEQRTTIRDVEAEAGPDEWTPKKLERRLIEAALVTQAIVGRVGPSGARGYWPPVMVEFADETGQVSQGTHLIDGNKIIKQATSAQITRAEEALLWPKRYVADIRVLKVFNAWVACKAYRWRWNRVVEERGWALATADRCRDRAKAQIIVGLRRDHITVR